MSRKPIISVEHNPGDPPIETDTDWDYVHSLTDEQIAAAVADDPDAAPINFFEKPGFIPIVNVLRLRTKLGMTQEEFAALYSIPIGTLRDWEQRRKRPDATARAYLKIIERDPEAVAKLLGSAA
jgi:putative transcriptional regulator